MPYWVIGRGYSPKMPRPPVRLSLGLSSFSLCAVLEIAYSCHQFLASLHPSILEIGHSSREQALSCPRFRIHQSRRRSPGPGSKVGIRFTRPVNVQPILLPFLTADMRHHNYLSYLERKISSLENPPRMTRSLSTWVVKLQIGLHPLKSLTCLPAAPNSGKVRKSLLFEGRFSSLVFEDMADGQIRNQRSSVPWCFYFRGPWSDKSPTWV